MWFQRTTFPPLNAEIENMTYSKQSSEFYPMGTVIASCQSIPKALNSGISLSFWGKRTSLLLDFEIRENMELPRGPCVETGNGARRVESRAQRETERSWTLRALFDPQILLHLKPLDFSVIEPINSPSLLNQFKLGLSPLETERVQTDTHVIYTNVFMRTIKYKCFFYFQSFLLGDNLQNLLKETLLDIYLGQMESIMYFVKYETTQHYFVVPEHHYIRTSTCARHWPPLGPQANSTNLRSAVPRLSHTESCLFM